MSLPVAEDPSPIISLFLWTGVFCYRQPQMKHLGNTPPPPPYIFHQLYILSQQSSWLRTSPLGFKACGNWSTQLVRGGRFQSHYPHHPWALFPWPLYKQPRRCHQPRFLPRGDHQPPAVVKLQPATINRTQDKSAKCVTVPENARKWLCVLYW